MMRRRWPSACREDGFGRACCSRSWWILAAKKEPAHRDGDAESGEAVAERGASSQTGGDGTKDCTEWGRKLAEKGAVADEKGRVAGGGEGRTRHRNRPTVVFPRILALPLHLLPRLPRFPPHLIPHRSRPLHDLHDVLLVFCISSYSRLPFHTLSYLQYLRDHLSIFLVLRRLFLYYLVCL